MVTESKAQYDDFASEYVGAGEIPCAKLEAELVRIALGDVTGCTVLDLGGGSGIHARQAVEAGAALVDVLDISSEMLRLGQVEEEEKHGRRDRIRWFQADLTKPLAEHAQHDQFQANGYDLIMVHWTFESATSLAELRGMWENSVALLKPGGRFIGARLKNIHAKYLTHGKYGLRCADFVAIPGGVQYKTEALTKQPFSWDCTAIEGATYPVTNDIGRELGLTDFSELAPEETQIVQSDREFWSDFIKDPFFVVVEAINGSI